MISQPLLSAALIVKDEERFLPACLASLQGVADEIVVVDTGSTDRTQSIARDAGAKVTEFAWIEDFSAARNQALDHATGKWIFYIDADERVRPESAGHLRTELMEPSFIGYEVLLYPLRGYSPYRSLRLFRNDPSVRFRGVIHETIWPALTEYRARHGGLMGQSELVLDHEGYAGERAAKDARNLPLLLKYLREDPTRVYCWCHVANIYTEKEEHELAEQAWNNALQVVRVKGAFAPEAAIPFVGMIERGLKLKRDVKPLLAEASELFPGNPRFEALRGQALIREGEFEKAIAVFESLVERGAAGDYDQGAAYDLKLFGAYAWEAIATCHFRLGNYRESRRYYGLAAEQSPEKMEYRIKQALCTKLLTDAKPDYSANP